MNHMTKELTPFDLANEVRMQRVQYSGSFLIVEGDTDARFFGALIDDLQCECLAAHGKQRVLETLSILNEGKVSGVLAVVDADFHHLGRPVPLLDNLLVTDSHDLEMMMLSSPAVDKLVAEFSSSIKLNRFLGKTGVPLIQTLLVNAATIGCLRLASEIHGWALTFRSLDFTKFVNQTNLEIDIRQLVRAVKDKSNKPGLDEIEVTRQTEALVAENHDKLQICCGHDVLALLSVGLLRLLGTNNGKDVSCEWLERSLRLAYEKLYFAGTNLCKAMYRWETGFPEYRVLSEQVSELVTEQLPNAS